jgi:hypothetical protein
MIETNYKALYPDELCFFHEYLLILMIIDECNIWFILKLRISFFLKVSLKFDLGIIKVKDKCIILIKMII